MTEAEHKLAQLEKWIAESARIATTYEVDSDLRARAFVASMAGSVGVILGHELGAAVSAVLRRENGQ